MKRAVQIKVPVEHITLSNGEESVEVSQIHFDPSRMLVTFILTGDHPVVSGTPAGQDLPMVNSLLSDGWSFVVDPSDPWGVNR